MEKNKPPNFSVEKRVKSQSLESWHPFCAVNHQWKAGSTWQLRLESTLVPMPIERMHLTARICSGFSLQLIIDREDLEGRQGTNRWGYDFGGLGEWVLSLVAELPWIFFVVWLQGDEISLAHPTINILRLAPPTGKGSEPMFFFCFQRIWRKFSSQAFQLVKQNGQMRIPCQFLWGPFVVWLGCSIFLIFIFYHSPKPSYPTGFPLVFYGSRRSWRLVEFRDRPSLNEHFLYWGEQIGKWRFSNQILKRQKASKKVHDQTSHIGDHFGARLAITCRRQQPSEGVWNMEGGTELNRPRLIDRWIRYKIESIWWHSLLFEATHSSRWLSLFGMICSGIPSFKKTLPQIARIVYCQLTTSSTNSCLQKW